MTESLANVRELSRVLEPFIGCVYFAPEVHQSYVDLGFQGSRAEASGVALPDGIAYFTSRGSLLGQVHGNLVASAFAVFNPEAVVPAVAAGWAITDASTIRAARQRGTLRFLERALGDEPDLLDDSEFVAAELERGARACRVEGRPLFAGVMAGVQPESPLGAAWFFGDALRECRGDSHTAAWISEDLDAVEIGLMTELYWGLPAKSYVRTRAWSDVQLDQGTERLLARQLLVADENGQYRLSEMGRTLRESIENRTDSQMIRVLTAMQDPARVISILDRWSQTVRRLKGYPGSGPQDLVAALQKR